MMSRQQMRERLKTEIKISARVSELRRLAADTAEAYERAVARSGMSREHFRLRAMLLGLLPPPSKDGG
jgi:hypothetical protein